MALRREELLDSPEKSNSLSIVVNLFSSTGFSPAQGLRHLLEDEIGRKHPRKRRRRTRVGKERLGLRGAFEDAATYELDSFTNKIMPCNTGFIIDCIAYFNVLAVMYCRM